MKYQCENTNVSNIHNKKKVVFLVQQGRSETGVACVYPGFFFFCGKLIFWNNCSHEGQIHSSDCSSIFAQHLKEESRGLL